MDGVRAGAVLIGEAELLERFSRSSGPGGQSVNTADSRVELRWDITASTALTGWQRARLLDRLAGRIVEGVLVVVASEHRSQLQNRVAARTRLASVVAEALAPPPPPRRPTRPGRGARERRLAAKRHRADTKKARGRPGRED
ncbi:alternative ribosome rescue aminoacyl-tRNA hydrolase ArfB [soil metagenome]